MSRTVGVVAAGSQATAEAGGRMLALGGNAVDALCASAFAAFIAEGLLCSPAGGGAAIVGDPDHGFEVLDFFAVTPGRGLDLAQTDKDFHDVDVSFGPTVQQFHVGRGSAAVPGALQGVLELNARRGSLPLREVLAPAVACARHGFAVGPEMAFITSILAPIIDMTPDVQAIFRPGGRDPKDGDTLYNPRLADFLEAVGREGPSLFDAVVAPALCEAFGPHRGGLITAADLQGYAPVWRSPLKVPFGDRHMLTNPPPSSGGTLIGFGLRSVNRRRLASHAFLSPEHVLDVTRLLGAVGEEKERARRQLGSTTHISVIDDRGEVAAMTMSNGEGSGYALDELGIVVNNFLGEEDINPAGFHEHAAGEWMTTMMAPTAVVSSEGPELVLGSGGSNRIRSAILQALLDALVYAQPLQACVSAPRIHVEGTQVYFESAGLPERSVEAMMRAHPDATRFEERNMFFGGVHAVGRQHGVLVGAGDPRRGGVVVRS
jgi:gamma-glutamyltranspeptidase/glutathione hydrolase